jgi:hypothetical protein
MQHLKQGHELARGAEDEIALEEWEGDAVAGAGDGARCGLLSVFRNVII